MQAELFNEPRILKVGDISANQICEMLGIKTEYQPKTVPFWWKDATWILPDGRRVPRPNPNKFENKILELMNVKIFYDFEL